MALMTITQLQIVLYYADPNLPSPHLPRALWEIEAAGLLQSGILKNIPVAPTLASEVPMPRNPSPCYALTECGRAFVAMLQDTPYPIQLWVDPRNAV